MSVIVESLVVDGLLKMLRQRLANEVRAVNLERKASIACPRKTPLTIASSGKSISWNVWSREEADARTRTVELDVQEYTMAALVDLINETEFAATGVNPASIVVAPDLAERLTLTAAVAPVHLPDPADSVCAFFPADGYVIAELGLDLGGQSEVRTPLRAPTWQAVMDGYPLQLDPNALQPGGLCIIFGDVTTKPVSQDIRRDLYEVTVDLTVWRAEPDSLLHRNREPMRAALRAVRQVLFTDFGRYLEAGVDGVQRVRETRSRIAGVPLRSSDAPNALLDLAEIQFVVTVHARPSSTPTPEN